MASYLTTPFRLLLLALIPTVMLGCVSTEKRFRQGVELENEGRLLEASERYIRVLQDEPDFEEARIRLGEIGPVIVQRYMDNAASSSAAGRFIEAHDQYAAVENFLRRTSAVGVVVPRPDRLDEFRATADSRAFDQLLTVAAGAAAAGDFARAIDSYARARGWPSVTPEQSRSIDEEIARVEFQWSQVLYNDGHYRQAFEHAASGMELVEPGSGLYDQLADLQDRAVRDGSVIVAFLPFGETDEVMRETSSIFTDDLNDVMLYQHWSVPPLFVVPADPVVVRREMRRISGRSARIVSRDDAIDIGRALDVDFVVAGELNRYEEDEGRVRERTYNARTRGRNAQDTSYVVRSYTIERTGRAAYRIYDVRRRSTLDRGSADASSSLAVERGEYAGDYNDLDLDGNQLILFDPSEIERQNEILDEALADELAAELADRIMNQILERVP